jgi:hypothetical protein
MSHLEKLHSPLLSIIFHFLCFQRKSKDVFACSLLSHQWHKLWWSYFAGDYFCSTVFVFNVTRLRTGPKIHSIITHLSISLDADEIKSNDIVLLSQMPRLSIFTVPGRLLSSYQSFTNLKTLNIIEFEPLPLVFPALPPSLTFLHCENRALLYKHYTKNRIVDFSAYPHLTKVKFQCWPRNCDSVQFVSPPFLTYLSLTASDNTGIFPSSSLFTLHLEYSTLEKCYEDFTFHSLQELTLMISNNGYVNNILCLKNMPSLEILTLEIFRFSLHVPQSNTLKILYLNANCIKEIILDFLPQVEYVHITVNASYQFTIYFWHTLPFLKQITIVNWGTILIESWYNSFPKYKFISNGASCETDWPYLSLTRPQNALFLLSTQDAKKVKPLYFL